MRYALAGVLVVAAFMLGRASADWRGPHNEAETSAAMAAVSGSPGGGISILDLSDDEPARMPSIAEQQAAALRRNEGGLEARLLRAQASQPGASPELVRRAAEAQRAGEAASQAEADRLTGAR